MDSHTHRTLDRLEIVEVGRRRRWSEAEKARIVLESMAGPRLVSATARRHGISRGLLLTWRRAFRPEQVETGLPTGFVPMVVATEVPSTTRPGPVKPNRERNGRIEIVVSRGRRIIVDADVDSEALSRILDILERR